MRLIRTETKDIIQNVEISELTEHTVIKDNKK